MDARTLLQPAVVTPKQALSIKPFGLEMDVLLTTEATGGATSVPANTSDASGRLPALHPFDCRTGAHLEPIGRLAPDAPDSTASTTRSRNSKEHGFGIDLPSKTRINARQIQLSKPAGESRFNSAEIRSRTYLKIV